MHPSDAIRGTKSRRLEGKLVVLGVTGSIGAVRTVEVARELIRHGAGVRAVMSEGAEGILTPEALRFATGEDVVSKITGMVEHVDLFGERGEASLLLVAPASANTIAKVAAGIADTPVTLCASLAVGRQVPLLMVPAMHGPMRENPALQEAMSKLEKWGVEFLVPPMEEGKLKVPDEEVIADFALRAVDPRPLKGRRVLIVSGSTEEPIDDVRLVTNRSSGRTGLALAREAFIRGATVEMLVGPRHPEPPFYVETAKFTTVESLASLAEKRKADFALVPAAISDFSPERSEGKISSERKSLEVRMRPTQKIIPLLAKRSKVVVGFKLESGVDEEELVERARRRAKENSLDLVVANRLEDVRDEDSVAHLVDADGNSIVVQGSREELARAVLDRLAKL